jgi:RNase H-like domain found in reverse transcriptase
MENIAIYLDDILIGNMTDERHIINLNRVVSQLLKHQLKGSAKKCQWGKHEIEFLVHKINLTILKISDQSEQRILDLQKPQTKKGLQKILGFTNFLRNFIVHYSKKTHDINDLMVNTKYKVNWSKENNKIWEQFIESIQKSAITNKLNENSQLVMTCDASGKGIGGVLFQHHGTDEEIGRKIAENTIIHKGI